MRTRSCPDHPDAMDALWIAAADGGRELEIDRCAECGSLWFDAGELEITAQLHARPSPARSARRCPVCRQAMRGAELPRELSAHRCDSCQGTWLEPKTVAALNRSQLPRPPGRHAKGPAAFGFRCARCSGQFPCAQGNATNKGLMCPACVVNPQVEKLGSGPTGTRSRLATRGDFLADTFDSIIDLFALD